MNGAPANPMSGVAPSCGEQAHGLGDVRDVVGRQVAQLGEVGPGADRPGDDRADPGDDVEVDADGRQGNHDVGEEDRGVDPVAAHRLQRDLGDEVRRRHDSSIPTPSRTVRYSGATGRPGA